MKIDTYTQVVRNISGERGLLISRPVSAHSAANWRGRSLLECRHRGDTVGDLDLANRAQLDRALGAVHRQPFEIDGRGDVMPACGIVEQLRQQIAAGLGPVDQMMMWVDDRQIGLDDLLAAAVKPVRPDRQMRAGRGSCGGLDRVPPLS